MAKEEPEKRGPVEKSEKGWPINPFGAVALAIFAVIVLFLIVRPLLSQKTTILQQDQQENAQGGEIESPKAGEIVNSNSLKVKLRIDEPSGVEHVEIWAKIYSENQWEKIGEIQNLPYELNWQIPASYQNKAIALTSHIYKKDGNIIKDPGGWREGIIILSSN